MGISRQDMRTVVLWDLDSTLADTVHRQAMIPAIRAGGEGAPTWDDYSRLCLNDDPINGSVTLLYLLYPHYLQYVVTGRSDAAADMTRLWMQRHSIAIDHLEMRPAGDDTDNAVFKIRHIRQLQASGYRVALFCDDWGPVAELITDETGVPVLGVNPFYPPEVQLEILQAQLLTGGAGSA
jgi:hypothetical protein